MTSHASLAAIMNASPQVRTLYNHLREIKGGISSIEAMHLYRIHALPRRISDMEVLGVAVRRERRKDRTGRAYVRYFLAK